MVSVDWNGKVFVWRSDIQEPTQLPTGGVQINQIAFSAAGDKLVTGSFSGDIQVWNPETGVLTGPKIEPIANEVTDIAFFRDDQTIIAKTVYGDVYRWNAQTGDRFGEAIKADEGFTRLAILSGDHFAAIGADKNVVINNGESGDHVAVIIARRPIKFATWMGRSTNLGIVLTEDNELASFEASNREADLLPGVFELGALTLSEYRPTDDIVLVFSVDQELRVASDNPGLTTTFAQFDAPVTATAIGAGGELVAAVDSSGDLRVYSHTGKGPSLLLQLERLDRGQINAMAFGKSGPNLEEQTLWLVNSGGTVEVKDIATGNTLFSKSFDVSSVDPLTDETCIALSPNYRLAAICLNQTVFFIDTATGEQTKSSNFGSSKFTSINFSVDGRYLSLGTETGRVRVLDTANGREVTSVDTTNAPIRAVGFSDLATEIYAITGDGQIARIFASPAVAPILVADADASKPWLAQLADDVFQPKGFSNTAKGEASEEWISNSYTVTTQITRGGTQVSVSSKTNNTLLAILSTAIGDGPSTEIQSVAESPDGRLLAIVAKDISIWRIHETVPDTGAPRLTSPIARLHRDATFSGAAFSPDGTKIAAVTSSGIWVWPVFPTPEALREAVVGLGLDPLDDAARCRFELLSEVECAN